MQDVVFSEVYETRVRLMVRNAHMKGQAVGIMTILEFMKDFEKKHIDITAKGMIEYLDSIHYRPVDIDPIHEVIERAEEAIKKAEAVLPIPDNVVKFPGKKK